MIRLDTIKLTSPIDSVINADSDKYSHLITEKGKGNDLVTDKSVAKGGDHFQKVGLNTIELDHLNERVNIQLSAKILGKHYHDLININTIDKVVTEINNSGVLTLDKNKFIDNAGTHLLDITANIPQYKDYDLSKSNKILRLASIGSGYATRTPRSSSTVIFTKGANYSTIYDKPKELHRDKPFKAELGNDFMNVVRDHYNEYRFEKKQKNYKQIRKAFDLTTTGTPMLMDILNSNSQPLYKAFDDITFQTKQMDLFLNLFNNDMTYNEIIEIKGIEQIVIASGFDETMIQTAIKMKTDDEGQSRATYYRRRDKALSVLQDMRVRELEGARSAKEHEIISHIKQYLKVA